MGTLLTKGWLILLPLLAGALPPFDYQRLPYRASWGPYTVIVEKAGPDGTVRAKIMSSSGRRLREVQDWQIEGLALREVTGGGALELQMTGYTGGAHCCFTDYLFTQDGGLATLVVFAGGNGRIHEVRDLNRDGRPEILASNDALAYFGGLSFASSPVLPLVIGWDGRRFLDQTSRFPAAVRPQAEAERSRFLKALAQRDQYAEEERRSAALGYLAHAILLGAGPSGRAWLLARAPASTRQWLLREEANLRKALAVTPGKICTSQRVILTGCP